MDRNFGVQPAEVQTVRWNYASLVLPWMSRSRSRYSRAAASGLLKNECNSREDSWMRYRRCEMELCQLGFGLDCLGYLGPVVDIREPRQVGC